MAKGGDRMDWTQTYTVHNSKGQHRRAVWVSDEVLAQRRQDRLCFRCGASGHAVSSCPYAPPVRPSENKAPVSRVTAQPPLVADSDAEDSEDESLGPRAGTTGKEHPL
ncbi:hypothetical protein CFIMG_008092RA00001 [Ceratocystis fimbriata CBS 114723]|uniref:CCHC-type domain-containing protein n=1 Tax=Ceratocystis fimbriata CBS 114723 TaxID=1035309 RepID=A0A2C5X6D1_9PEZI|nr:hypothetical protein CFIMG_008092RA00001 [Ceratocystis fimbriata CBS 114723]